MERRSGSMEMVVDLKLCDLCFALFCNVHIIVIVF